MKLKNKGEEAGDCTAPYDVEFNAKTVCEFIEEVISERPDFWGEFRIDDGKTDWIKMPSVEYRYGKVLDPLPGGVKDRAIKEIYARGGWSAMDFRIKII